MKVMIAYYSRKGTTGGLVGMIRDEFKAKGMDVSTVLLKHVKRTGFLKTARDSIKAAEVELTNAEADLDMAVADIVIIGGPVFAGNINPYTKVYLKRATGLEGKPGGVFICCAKGPEAGDEYVEEMANLASEEGVVVRAKLMGSLKVKDEYPARVDAFVAQVLEGLPAGAGEDDDKGAITNDPPIT